MMTPWIRKRTSILMLMEIITQGFVYTQESPARSDLPPKSFVQGRLWLSLSPLLHSHSDCSGLLQQVCCKNVSFLLLFIPFRLPPSGSVVMTAIFGQSIVWYFHTVGHVLWFSLFISGYIFLMAIDGIRPNLDLLHVCKTAINSGCLDDVKRAVLKWKEKQDR